MYCYIHQFIYVSITELNFAPLSFPEPFVPVGSEREGSLGVADWGITAGINRKMHSIQTWNSGASGIFKIDILEYFATN